jgi:hypothetical protein
MACGVDEGDAFLTRITKLGGKNRAGANGSPQQTLARLQLRGGKPSRFEAHRKRHLVQGKSGISVTARSESATQQESSAIPLFARGSTLF